MISVSVGHIILTPTQPVGSGRPQQESNPRPPNQESRALPTELPPFLPPREVETDFKANKSQESKEELFTKPKEIGIVGLESGMDI